MEAFEILSYKARKKKKKLHFLSFSGWGVYISWNIHSKSILAVILRGQPIFTASGWQDMENHAISSL